MSIRRKAFTLIELMIVILILGVLAGLVIVGFGVLGKPAQEKDTRQALHNLRNTLEELRLSTNLANFYPQNDNNWPRPLPPPVGTMTAESAKSPSAWANDQVLAICNTRILLHKMRQVPKVKGALGEVPSARQFKFKNAGSRTDDPILHESPVILDAWGVPILLVPAEGLGTVAVPVKQGGQTYVVTSVKRRPPSELNNGPLVLPGAKPFFVSAGADGDFSTGDDNLYSFED